MKVAWAIVSLAAWAGVAAAEITPKAGPGDPHIQTVDFDNDQVVSLRVALGYQLTLELADDERIETVSVGNSSVWQVSANNRGDHLFIKPNQGASATNLTVITDARRYAFNLIPAYAMEPDFPYTVRFQYRPAPSARPAASTPPNAYRFTGDKTLHPSNMFDDGRFTYMAWPPEAALPAVFMIDADGQEALVNGAVRDGYLVAETIAQKFVFRRGEATGAAMRLAAKAR